MTLTITEFLEGRIAEDEAECKPIAALEDDDRGGWATAYAERVLAECAAKRAIISLAKKTSEFEKWYDDHEWQGTVESTDPLTGDAILRALATVYADHPDYQQEWAPLG